MAGCVFMGPGAENELVRGRCTNTPAQMIEKCYRALFQLRPEDTLPGRPAEYTCSVDTVGESPEDMKASCDANVDVKGPIIDLS